jgi:hypothetical protein
MDTTTDATIHGLISEILSGASSAGRKASGRLVTAASEVETLAREDYRSAVRKIFHASEIQELLTEARRMAWPHLNEESIRLVTPEEFARHWSPLGVDFKLADMSSAAPGGLAILGFYIHRPPGAQKPLICVNTAHHQAAVGAAFAHEMGHHVAAQVFGPEPGPLPLLYTGYRNHLEDSRELAADVLVSVGIFPRKTAKRTFRKRSIPRERREELAPDGEFELGEVLEYYLRKYGLSVDAKLSSGQNLQYLAGMLHYAKLRVALLDGYDI